MPTPEPSLPEALDRQIVACERLGSPQYADLFRKLAADYHAHGLTWELLHDRPELPLRDALLLRYVGSVHRIVLRGDAPRLADHYPSAGGDGSPVPLDEFLDVVRSHRDEVVAALSQQVQTNEVGRCAALILGFAEVARRTGLPLNMLEIGASAGLISNWDRYWYDTGSSTAGDPASAVRLTGRWQDPYDLSGLTPVARRAGCDISPLDPTNEENRRRLLGFVWPDQRERSELLEGALRIADAHPTKVHAIDAGAFLARELPARPGGTATIVFHSIVWQYLPKASKDLARRVLREEGTTAGADRAHPAFKPTPAELMVSVAFPDKPSAKELQKYGDGESYR